MLKDPKCPICGREFSEPIALHRWISCDKRKGIHMESYEIVLGYECDYCDQVFVDQTATNEEIDEVYRKDIKLREWNERNIDLMKRHVVY